MALEPLNLKLVPIALSASDTGDFERFGQAFYAALSGRAFIPLGGMHDGGAEGFLEPELFGDNAAHHFLQISKQKGLDAKVRQTAARLRQFGRSVSSLTYLTSEIVPHIDREEERLSDELDVGFEYVMLST
jgi:hypothetical protein